MESEPSNSLTAEETLAAAAMSTPTKRLPSGRVAFGKQLDILRAIAAASSASGKGATPPEVGGMVGLAPSTVALTSPFFTDIGLASRVEGGLAPSESVVNFHQAFQWDAEQAGRELAPVIRSAWFARLLMPKLSFGPLPEQEALMILAREAQGTKAHTPQLRIILEYMETAGLIVRDGDRLLAGNGQPADRVELPGTDKPDPPSDEHRTSQDVTAASHPLIKGLFQELPPPGSKWPKEKHDAWLELAKVAFRMIYAIEAPEQPPQDRRHPEPPPS